MQNREPKTPGEGVELRFQVGYIPWVLGIAVACAGLLVQIGWMLGNAPLKSIVPGFVAMNPVTSLAFILSGAALGLKMLAAPKARRLAAVAAWLVLLVGLQRLANYSLHWDFTLDRLMYPDSLGSNRMAPNTAFNFFSIGLSLLFLDASSKAAKNLSQLACLAAGFVAFLTLSGYLYNQAAFTRLAPSYIAMALNTALCFEMICLGLLFSRPQEGFAGVVLSNSIAGVMARRLIPLAIAAPLLMGWLRLKGEEAGFYSAEIGMVFLSVATILVFCIVIWWNASQLLRLDLERKKAAVQLEEKNRELEEFTAVVAHDLKSPLTIISMNCDVIKAKFGPCWASRV